MKWVKRTFVESGRIAGIAVDSQGTESVLQLEQFPEAMASSGSGTTMRTTVRLRHLVAVQPGEYWVIRNFPEVAGNLQAVYAANVDGKRALIPASLLIAALFGWLKNLNPAMASPTGPDLLGSPDFEGVAPGWATSGVVVGDWFVNSRSNVERLLWFRCFPSAYRCWSSLANSVKAGVLALDLPDAEVSIALKGTQREGTLAARSCTLISVKPLEEPVRYASALESAEFLLNGVARNNVGLIGRRQPRRDFDLAQNAMGWRLSDEEWDAVSEKLRPLRSRNSMPSRDVLSTILEKLGTGLPWAHFQPSIPKERHRDFNYSRLVKDGRWAIVHGTVMEMRGLTARS